MTGLSCSQPYLPSILLKYFIFFVTRSCMFNKKFLSLCSTTCQFNQPIFIIVFFIRCLELLYFLLISLLKHLGNSFKLRNLSVGFS